MPALDGMRVLDMTQYEAGTSCTQALAWQGADVVKVEPPGVGDPGRGLTTEGRPPQYFLNYNSNKRSIVIDLATERGREILLDLAPRFDVFVENYGPGVVEKLDIGYEALRERHPSIIYARIKGFGLSGPYADFKCFDSVALAAGGAYSINGEPDGPPMRPGASFGDTGTGLQMALAIVSAYVQQQRTGEGQLIELSMQEAVTYFMKTMGREFWGSDRDAPRVGNGLGAPTNVYPSKGGGSNDYVHICVVTSRMWDTLCAALERPDLATDPRYETAPSRREHASRALRGSRAVDARAHEVRGDARPRDGGRALHGRALHPGPAERPAPLRTWPVRATRAPRARHNRADALARADVGFRGPHRVGPGPRAAHGRGARGRAGHGRRSDREAVRGRHRHLTGPESGREHA